MTRSEFWKIVGSLGWSKTADYNAIKARLLAELTAEQAVEFAKHVSECENELCAAVVREGGDDYCCDSWSDVLAHVVGLGQQEHTACVKHPDKLMARYRKSDYTESFAYCIPYKDDYAKLSLDGFTEWLDRELKTYREAREPGFCDTQFQLVLAALELLRAGDVEGFLATEQAGRKAAEDIEREAATRIRRAQRYGGGMIVIDGGSVANKWGVWNLYSDVRMYLKKGAA